MTQFPPNLTRQELREWVRSQLQPLLEQKDFQAAKALLVPIQPVDIADAIEDLPSVMQAIAFRLLSKDEAIEVYEYLDPAIQEALLEDFKRPDVLEVVDGMSPDDRVRLFDELPAKVVRQLFYHLSAEERDATALLLGYPANTAGRMMTPEYVSLKESWTVAQALERIRQVARSTETIYYLYITDISRRLNGILSLRDLLTADLEVLISQIMNREVVRVETNTDQEEVARIIQDYDLIALPVVDREQRLVGIVTVDDILDVLEEETTEDIYTLGGLQSDGDDYFRANLFTIARKRVVWLLVLLVTNTATSAVIRSQEDVLERVVALAAFIPLLIDTGGNVGSQSSTVIIRGLNTDNDQLRNRLSVIRREAIAGSILGAMLGVIVTVWAYFLQGDIGVALAVGISLFAISLIASIAGSGLPFLFQAFKLDPALMSAPFITTAVDVFGVLIYLNVARWILRI
ncbi:Mg2+ transport protein [Leptolyngbya boryana NIES-2135]|uniref:Magnesium transporter MgtE n=1 Tax=Leptolyngbya boryana NIES-2135 TaxID=1973484 RepID=A0A1Z4JJJ5_LEPBY|nr:magnesium transporter [Leptolyngbya boryana]MBD2368981.1 magnesium transporter [Leptolyngbya sp. FACHB-161]MBD2375811.1 magnesium transporter [Leptolyngbya sp. FACHB-238]MBD2399925.1 magnesium transporter [Leptolyngbya sp. FACHB-239]MBD2406131.1 magnesium transporter [Leptolyngbya sp. FACHB-402]BAY56904.1 Mg2+ transport protein [Leptolyngbya boryana NIES-2135]